MLWRQAVAGSRCGRSALLQMGDGDTVSNSYIVAVFPGCNPGLLCPVMTHAKQRVTSNGLRSFRMWKHARANLCASALIATALLVLAWLSRAFSPLCNGEEARQTTGKQSRRSVRSGATGARAILDRVCVTRALHKLTHSSALRLTSGIGISRKLWSSCRIILHSHREDPTHTKRPVFFLPKFR